MYCSSHCTWNKPTPTYANLHLEYYRMRPFDSINVTTALSLCTFSITYQLLRPNYCKHLSCGLHMIAMLWLLQWVVVVAGLVWAGAGMHWQCCMVCPLSTHWLLCQVKQDGYTAFSICLCSNFLYSIWSKCSNWSAKCLYPLLCTLDTYVYTCINDQQTTFPYKVCLRK